MEILFNLAKAVIGMMVVMALWFGIQTFVRRRNGCGANQDVLDFMKHGCAGCTKGACENRGKQKEHHELT